MTQAILQPGQEYVSRISAHLGIKTQPLYHPRATSACQEKVELLQQRFPDESWHLGRVVKTLFAAVDEDWVGFVLPERGRKFRLTGELAGNVYRQACLKTAEEEYWVSTGTMYMPPGMEAGTCTPFVPEDVMMRFEDHIFICDLPELDDQEIDISLGGQGEEAHRTSMVLPYGAIFQILDLRFPGKIHKVKF